MKGLLTTMDWQGRWAWHGDAGPGIPFFPRLVCCVMLPPPPHRISREDFRAFCLDNLRGRHGRGRRGVPPRRRDLFDVTRVVLDSIPDAHVTVDILVRLMVIQGRPSRNAAAMQEVFEAGRDGERRYPAQAAGHEYQYRSFLDERVVDGSLQVLVDWAPTWERRTTFQSKVYKHSTTLRASVGISVSVVVETSAR